VIVENFSGGDSYLHLLDPRVKLCLAFPYAFIIALSDKLIVGGIALILSLILILSARLSLLGVVKSLKLLFFFLLLLWIVLPVSISGVEIFSIGPLSVSEEGIARALSITLKSTSIVLLIIALLATSTVFSLVHAMSHFRVPKKLLYLTFLSYRYIHVLQVEYLRLRDAMRIRGFRPKTNLHTYKTFGYLIGMLLIRSYERSERIWNAMLCRGFQGRFYLLDHFKAEGRDFIFLSVMSIIFVGIGWLEWIVRIM
jgi:cobalt/nickel transport system permease protein